MRRGENQWLSSQDAGVRWLAGEHFAHALKVKRLSVYAQIGPFAGEVRIAELQKDEMTRSIEQ